ncbi:hypothetical protein DPMN_076984 [Dreissena polymorpha]|uniref:Uncharacterized protein n=1 Tax=Dreissena polymorpha TaxID=45954 RepID=A0A9D4BG86_DREPO|nr:hypothetical protein DPMN_076984 [Dreissena polymorpha]
MQKITSKAVLEARKKEARGERSGGEKMRDGRMGGREWGKRGRGLKSGRNDQDGEDDDHFHDNWMMMKTFIVFVFFAFADVVGDDDNKDHDDNDNEDHDDNDNEDDNEDEDDDDERQQLRRFSSAKEVVVSADDWKVKNMRPSDKIPLRVDNLLTLVVLLVVLVEVAAVVVEVVRVI